MDGILIYTDHITILTCLFSCCTFLDSVCTIKDFMDNNIETSLPTMCMGTTL